MFPRALLCSEVKYSEEGINDAFSPGDTLNDCAITGPNSVATLRQSVFKDGNQKPSAHATMRSTASTDALLLSTPAKHLAAPKYLLLTRPLLETSEQARVPNLVPRTSVDK